MHDHEVRIDLRITSADLEHLHLDPNDTSVLAQFARLAAESLAVINEEGRRLDSIEPILSPQTETERAGALLRFTLGAQPGALSVRILPGSPLSQHGGLLDLQSSDGARSLRLTPDGAPATVRDPSAAPPDDPAEAWVWHGRFERIQALIDRDEEGVRLDVIIPIPLVATWMPIPRQAPDALTPEEAAPTLAAFAALVRDHLTLRVGGQSALLTIKTAVLLAPSEPRIHAATSHSALSFWSAAAVIHLRAADASCEERSELELRWSLFNPAIKRIHIKSMMDPAARVREVTPTAPVTLWNTATPQINQ